MVRIMLDDDKSCPHNGVGDIGGGFYGQRFDKRGFNVIVRGDTVKC